MILFFQQPCRWFQRAAEREEIFLALRSTILSIWEEEEASKEGPGLGFCLWAAAASAFLGTPMWQGLVTRDRKRSMVIWLQYNGLGNCQPWEWREEGSFLKIPLHSVRPYIHSIVLLLSLTFPMQKRPLSNVESHCFLFRACEFNQRFGHQERPSQWRKRKWRSNWGSELPYWGNEKCTLSLYIETFCFTIQPTGISVGLKRQSWETEPGGAEQPPWWAERVRWAKVVPTIYTTLPTRQPANQAPSWMCPKKKAAATLFFFNSQIN